MRVDSLAVSWLVEQGYDRVYGARPLRRVIQRVLLDGLSGLLLGGEIREGDVVEVSSDGEVILLNGLVIRGEG